jgi:hypothetical protein
MLELVEVERCRVINIGGYLYTKIPACLKRQYDPGPGDEVTYHRSSDNGDTIIRIDKNSSASAEKTD